MRESTNLTKRNLPPGWRWVKLGEVCQVIGGSTPSTGNSDYWDGDIVWVTPTDLGKLDGRVISSSSRRITSAGYQGCGTEILPAGTIVMSSRAPIGHVGIAGVPLCTNQGCKSFVPGPDVDSAFLYWSLKWVVPDLQALGSGATFTEVSKSHLQRFEILLPPLAEQKRIAATLNEQMAVVERAQVAAQVQFDAAKALQFAYVHESLVSGKTERLSLEECLVEVTEGVGSSWNNFPALGATREGLAPAKEPVGKAPGRYKLVDEGTVFYNPMRIMIGSIAQLDQGETVGITSPDYVVFKCRTGVLHHRWFYHWLRSALGEQFIRSLARGAVRERMLFRRLTSGVIDVPSWALQLVATERIQKVRPLIEGLGAQLNEINALPTVLLRRAFAGEL